MAKLARVWWTLFFCFYKVALAPHSWLCHVDDDIYVNIDVLVKTLAKFDPKEELVYFGRSGSPYGSPRLVKNESKLGTPNTPYHFAVGGMYCLSRRMLELAKDHLV